MPRIYALGTAFGDIVLGYSCTYCGGTKKVDVEWDKEGEPTKCLPCGECDGRGMHLTSDGENLVDFMKKLGVAGLMLFAVVLQGCGTDAEGSGTASAIEIPGPNGVRCFAIMNGNGDVVGGNCR